MASVNTPEKATPTSPTKEDLQKKGGSANHTAASSNHADKGTATTFSDSELLRKVQFPLAQGSHETAVKTAPPGNGLAEELRTTIRWNDISCTVPIVRGIFEKTVESITKPSRRKTAVRSMSGCAGPGDLVAILGPPNSGKSTLLNILSGYCREGYSGEVLINGARMGVDELSDRSCHVPQTDLHLDCFSVKETLWIAAELKFPTSTERKDKFRAVVNAMERWGLMDVRRIPVSLVSKTHRRLLTCAEQLIRPQPLIFVDDPTRNVDAMQAHICLRTLKYLAYKGHTVIVVISNPTSVMLKYITKIYVLAEGRLIYSGVPADLRNHLGAHGFLCPADVSITEYLLQVAAKMYGGLRALAETETMKAKEMQQQMKQPLPSSEPAPIGAPPSDQPQGVTVEPRSPKAAEAVDGNDEGGKASGGRRNSLGNIFESRETVDSKDLFSLLFNRFIFYTFRSSVYMSYRQFINISFIVIFANVFNSVGVEHNFTDMNVAFVFLYMSCLSALSLLSATLKTPLLIQHAIHEQRYSLYGKKIYFLARVTCDIMYEIMFSVSSGIFDYYLTHQPKEESRIFFFLCFGFQVSMLGQALGTLIGTIFEWAAWWRSQCSSTLWCSAATSSPPSSWPPTLCGCHSRRTCATPSAAP
ncbi:ATP-binding cassette sub-family G member 1-like isoform X2 [Dermacentor albipictus]|uniref:ATP-binding cassette sub-family G member 1-like isoform X2 n=1 Tax=Dermacentor albipictus TaxID=60249 RepID=UPI0031FCE0A5